MAGRVGIFIDGPNLYGGIRRLTGDGSVDIVALVHWLARERDVTEVAFWTGQLRQQVNAERYAAQQRFFAHIVTAIPNARIGRATLRQHPGRWVEKGVDVGVALDLVLGAWEDRWDTGIVVSGDGDIARAGQLVRSTGRGFEVASCPGSLSSLLREQATEVRWIDAELIERIR